VAVNATPPSATCPPQNRSPALLALAALMSSSTCRRIATGALVATAPGDAGTAVESAATWGGLRARTVGERKHPRQVVILLHGWGAPGTDLVPLGDVLAEPGRLFVFPEGPLVSQGGGRAWWEIDMARLLAAREEGQERDLRQETPRGMAEAREQLTALVAEVTRRARVPAAAVVLGGFSQGAMLATDVALASPTSVGGLVILSGSLVSESAWTARLHASKPAFPIFMSHGRGDPVLPFRLAEALRDHLYAAGLNITWTPFPGGHEIPNGVLAKLQAFLAAAVPAAPVAPSAH
jgi:phospholipase/carboxylesterase